MPESMSLDRLFTYVRKMDEFAKLDVSSANTALHFIEHEFQTSGDPFERYRAICWQIGVAASEELRKILIHLRDRFEG
jgi:hypothetical protein